MGRNSKSKYADLPMSEVARLGGQATLRKYGIEELRRWSRKGFAKAHEKVKQRPSSYYQNLVEIRVEQGIERLRQEREQRLEKIRKLFRNR